MNRYYCIDKKELERTTYYVRVFSSSRNINVQKFEDVMERLHFSFHKGSEPYADCYEKSYVTEEELRKLNKDLDRYKKWIRVKKCLQMYARSPRYRQDFVNRTPKMYYHCSYCGKRIDQNHMTVDHIFPVQKMMDSEQTRRHAMMLGINETNSMKNLTAACYECNKAKSNKTGFWIVRGLFGKYGGLRIAAVVEGAITVVGVLMMFGVV